MEPFGLFFPYTCRHCNPHVTENMKLSLLVILLAVLPAVLSAQDITDDAKARKIFEEVDQRRDRISSRPRP